MQQPDLISQMVTLKVQVQAMGTTTWQQHADKENASTGYEDATSHQIQTTSTAAIPPADSNELHLLVLVVAYNNMCKLMQQHTVVYVETLQKVFDANAISCYRTGKSQKISC